MWDTLHSMSKHNVSERVHSVRRTYPAIWSNWSLNKGQMVSLKGSITKQVYYLSVKSSQNMGFIYKWIPVANDSTSQRKVILVIENLWLKKKFQEKIQTLGKKVKWHYVIICKVYLNPESRLLCFWIYLTVGIVNLKLIFIIYVVWYFLLLF